MMPITRSQGQALAALLHQLRGDWDLPGINAAIRKAAAHGSAADVAVAACRCAANPEMRTPALISEPGTHWQGTVVGTRQAPLMCAEHPTQPARHCADCTALAVPKPAGFVIPARPKLSADRSEWVPPRPEPDGKPDENASETRAEPAAT